MADYQQIERQALNKGLNLRDEPESLGDGQWRRLTNVRSFSEGSLSTRPGRRWVAGFRDDNVTHTLTKLGGQIISGSGTRVYRNGEPYPTVFNGGVLSVVRHKASDGDERWLYVTDGSEFRMLGEDGSDIKWGITAPTRKVVATATADVGLLDSSQPGATVYNWRAVYKNSRTGGKSNPSPEMTAGIDVILHKALLVADSSLDGQVDQVEFYRQGGLNGSATWKLVGTSPNKGLNPDTNSPWPVECVDNLSDADAVKGAPLRVDNDVPFTTKSAGGNAVYEAVFKYIWGPFRGSYLFAAGDPNRPGDVYWTNPGRPHSASPFNHVTVSPPDEPIMGGFVHGDAPYVWTRENLYLLDFQGEDALVTFVPQRTWCGRGLSLPHAFAVGPWIWFFSKDGVYYTDGQSPAEPFTETDIRPIFNPQVEDRVYVAPGSLAEVAWPPFDIAAPLSVATPGRASSVVRDFEVSAPTTPLTVSGGSTVNVTVTVTSLGQFWDDVGLSLTPASLPAGLSYAFSPSSGVPGTGSFTSTLTITASASAVAGSFTFQIRGKRVGGSLSHLTSPIALTVGAGTPPTTGSFTVTLSPSTLSVARGTFGHLEVLVAGVGAFSSPVTLGTAVPANVFATLGQTQVTPPGAPIPLTLSVAETAALGQSTVTVTGTSGATSVSASLLLTVTGVPGEPPSDEELLPTVRMAYGGQELHIHYLDKLGQWIHLRNHLPYSRWSNDESPEVPGGYGTVYETISFFDEEQANTALLIGTNLGLVALETGTFDYVEGCKIRCRVRDRSDNFNSPRTLKEFGNIIIEADCGDAVLPYAINPSQPTGIAFIPFLDSEQTQLGYQRIAGTGRQRFPRAFKDSFGGEPVYGYSLGVDLEWNGNATVYGWLTQVHPDEEYITNWAFGPTTHGMRGWQQARDIYLTVTNPFSVLTPTVEIDGELYGMKMDDGSTTIPISTRKQKVHLWLPPVKGKVYRWSVVGSKFKMFGNEAELRVKEIASGLTYQVVNPFAGGTAEV